MDERQWIHAIQRGEKTYLEDIAEKYYDDIFRFCAFQTGNGEEACDLAQETFLRALIHLADLEDLSPSQRRAWLRKTARNLWIDSLRKHSRETYPGEEALKLFSFEEDFTRGQVAGLLNCLPPEEGPLFRMRYFEGYNATELGEIFDLPAGTVRSRLSSARIRLQKMLKE